MKLLKTAVLFASLIFATAGFAIEFKRAETFDDAFGASCRVSVPGARGSGTFVYYNDRYAYILTNYHVVTTNNEATVEFWTNSKLQRVPGKVIWRYYDIKNVQPKDFAFIAVDSKLLKREIDPPFMPLAGPNVRPSEDSYICSAGAPDGRFVQAWKGKVVGYYNGETVEFQPPPVPGQSGSGIISFYDGELWLTAVLTWLFGEKGKDESTGGAIPIANLYEAVKNRPLPAAYHEEDNTPSIPDNASECSAPNLRAIIFSAPDCAACKKAKDKGEFDKVAKELESAIIDTSTPDGYTLAYSYAITKIPTIAIIDQDDNCVCVVSPQEIAKGEAVKKITDFSAQYKKEVSPPPTESVGPFAEEESSEDIKEPDRTKFRDRASVREKLIDTGLIDESESRWFNRRGRQPENPPEEDEEEEAPDSSDIGNDKNDKDASSRLLSRLTNNIVNKVGDQIKIAIAESLDTATDTIEEKIEQKAKEKYEEIEPVVTKKIRSIIFKGCVLFIILTIFSLLIVGTVKKCLSWCKKQIILWVSTMKIPEENKPS